MKKYAKLISTLLAVIMLLSSLSALFTVEIFAAEESTEAKGDGKTETESGKEEGSEAETGKGDNSGNKTEPVVDPEEKAKTYLETVYANPSDKLQTMLDNGKPWQTIGDFELYVDEFSGEVACKNTKTGEVIFTNPYDVGASTGVEDTKYELLSQIMVDFTDNQGQTKIFTSFQQAAARQQINVERIKGGVRVEYTIGREQAKTLVPRLISQERFEEHILQPLIDYFGADELYNEDTENKEIHNIQKLMKYYGFYAKNTVPMTADEREKATAMFGYFTDNLQKSDRDLGRVLNEYPIVDSMNVYVFDPQASATVIERCEQIIMTYCPEYTYEELDYDHALTEYESEDENPPVFRMALEYKIDPETGLVVRLPANGIRFNESLYTLNNITVLPYMGAGSSAYEGYNFFPDGSGALFDFQDLHQTSSSTVVGKVYGTDFAYHEISGKYQKTIRYPVFGIVEETKYYSCYAKDPVTGEKGEYIGTVSGAIYDTVVAKYNGESSGVCKGSEEGLTTKYGSYILDPNGNYIMEEIDAKHGFVAVIEEGDALASLTTYHAGSMSDYNTIMMSFTPRPKDTYNLKDSISVADNSEWTVVSDRKYVGGYTVRYFMLSDPASDTLPEGAQVYDASWLGMAKVYRDYLTAKGVINPLKSDDVTDNIPLYVETFGTVETTEKILSIPVDVMSPLTTFEDVANMYEQLKGEGIKNVNFKLTGYANGGMYYTVPGKLKFEKAVGGKDGFQELLNKANSYNTDNDPNTNLGIYPDFNIVYSLGDDWFDGYSSNKHAARTIDDRYAQRREYSATQQKYENFFETVISPAYFYVLYERITKNYAEKYDNVMGISVSTLGSWLNSDFDEDEPYNREDSKDFTVDAFEYLDRTYKNVMTEGGNAYVWKYVDHMLDVSLDSSRYSISANSVPFIGVVLHGSVSFAGEPLNMEGDLKYAILKAIENGASPYFILSMQNTQALKEYFDLSRYYSIRYDIWSKDIADVYNKLNSVLGDVQDKYIIGHEFLEGGTRVPDADELREDILNIYNQVLENNLNAAEIFDREQALAVSAARQLIRDTLIYLVQNQGKIDATYADAQNRMQLANFGPDYYNKVLQVNKNYYTAGIAAKDNTADPDFAIANAIRNAVRNYNADEAVIKAAAEIVYKTLTNDLNDVRTEALNSYIGVALEKQEDAWTDKFIASVDVAGKIKTVLLSYYGYESAEAIPAHKSAETLAEIDAMVTELVNAAGNKDSIVAYLKTKLADVEDAKIETLADQIVAVSNADANLLAVVASYFDLKVDSIPEEDKAKVNTMVSDLKAKIADRDAVEAYLEGRDEHYSKFVDKLVADLRAAGTDYTSIYSCFTTPQYVVTVEIRDTVVDIINSNDAGRAELISVYTAQSNASVALENAQKNVDDTAKAYDKAKEAYEKAKADYDAAKAASDAAPDKEDVTAALEAAQKALKDAEVAMTAAETAMKAAASDLEAKNAAIAALGEFTTAYATLIDAYNKFNAGRIALELVGSHNAVYSDVYDVVLAREEYAVFESFNSEGTKYSAEVEAGYTKYTETNAAYVAVVDTLTPAKVAGAVDKYIYAVSNLNAVEAIDYDCDKDEYSYFFNANTVLNSSEYSRTSAVTDCANAMGSSYHFINTTFEAVDEMYAGVLVALETIRAAESDREGGIETSKVWAEAEGFKAEIDVLYEAYKAIYDDVVGEDGKGAASKAVQAAKDMVASLKVDKAFNDEVDQRIKDLIPVVKDEENKDDEIIDNTSKYETENIVAVTYGTNDGKAYKTIILNYNNYTVCIVYNGMEYTIPAYEYAEIKLS